jgi:hypothetical protein
MSIQAPRQAGRANEILSRFNASPRLSRLLGVLFGERRRDVGAAWYVSPPSEEMCRQIEELGVAAPPATETAAAPTPQQVFKALETFPEYRTTLRRRTRKPPGKGEQQSIQIDLRREDGSHAIEIDLLRVTADDEPALFVFAHYGKTEALAAIVAELAEVCGPLILWHDAGETPVVVYPTRNSEQSAADRPRD